MNNQQDWRFHKTVIINRAVSGSGKTTLSRCVTEALRSHGLTVSVHSTDDFFMRNGRYVFELDKLNSYHAQNLANFTAALEQGIDVVICDNMNLLPWQSQPYTTAARKYHYRILFLNFLPRDIEKHLAAQVVTPTKPDAHGLSREILERFIKNFNDYNDLLDRNTVRDIHRHHVFVWNDVDKVAMDTGELAQYFDSDVVLTIHPEDYSEMKRTLGDTVLKIITETDDELKQREVKKHYLLTWYGITDIRAALGLEPSDGPVLGALRTGRYTDVIVLGYTNLNKSQDAFSGELRKEWEQLHEQPLETRLAYPRQKAQVMVDAICNTERAHALFQKYLQDAHLPINIRLLPQTLSHLNDARAIDKAAQKALRLALSDEAEKEITCFLSPGTPVMAYTWAMVSRANPNLHLRVISSSDPRKPPEEIELPKDVLSPTVVAKNNYVLMKFDVLIHLVGTETNIPQFFSLVQFPTKKHWFITSADSGKVKALRYLLPPGATMETKVVDAFVPAQTRKAIEGIVLSLPQETRIGVNLTGGTKLMFAGGLNTCNEYHNTEPFYFEIKQHHITFIRTGITIPFKGVTSIDGFFTASGYDIITPGFWNDNPVREARKEITLKLWEKRELFWNLYQSKDFRDYKLVFGKPDPPFDFNVSKLRAKLNVNKATLELEGQELRVPDCTDFGTYLGGGWFEEYTYLQLLPLLKEGLIFDLRIGLEISPPGQPHQEGGMPFGEFDCVFTDGKRLFMVECKAGSVKQEHIQKLENNLKNYGGIAARGILVTAFQPVSMIEKRIDTLNSINALSDWDVNTQELKKIISKC